LNDYERALEQFKMARSELHSDPDVMAGLAFVHLRQGRFEKAQEEFRQAAILDPVSPSRYWALAHSYWSAGKLRMGLEAMNRAITLTPDLPGYYAQKAGLLGAMYGRWEPIDDLVREALEHCDTLDLAAESWWLVDRVPGIDLGELISHFRESRRSSDDLARYYGSLARAYNIIDDTSMMRAYFDSARQRLEKKVEEAPDDPHHASNLGLVLAFLGECEQAVSYGQRGKELLSVKECHW
jgi:tetratricopeptide (TPR) repeat protein